MALAPTRFDPPLVVLSVMPLTLFVFKMGKKIISDITALPQEIVAPGDAAVPEKSVD